DRGTHDPQRLAQPLADLLLGATALRDLHREHDFRQGAAALLGIPAQRFNGLVHSLPSARTSVGQASVRTAPPIRSYAFHEDSQWARDRERRVPRTVPGGSPGSPDPARASAPIGAPASEAPPCDAPPFRARPT